MKTRIPALGFAALFVLDSGLAAGDIPDREAYAYRFPLHLEEPAEFIAAEIPLEVYRSVSDPTLRDLGVYNAAGQAVPRKIDRPDEDVGVVEHETPLGIVPLYGEIQQSGERLRLLMRLNDAGTSLQFRSTIPEPADPELELRALIVDLREQEEEFVAIGFEWPETSPGFIGQVVIEDGDDLAKWRRLASGTLADLEFEGTRIQQRKVELKRGAGDFLRITWRDMPAEWRPESVSGIIRERGPDEAREWLALDPIARSEDGREFIYHINGYPPVDRVDLQLPGRNVVVRASVDYGHGPQGGWRRAHEGLFYRVSRGGSEIDSAPAMIGSARAARWRVNIHSGQVDGEPRLRLGWRPERLLFLSQGDLPYTLATGRAQDAVEQFPQQRLLGDSGIFSMLERTGTAGHATIGARREGAGAMVMEGARTWTWRTVAVWIGLFGAVLFVGYLAWSLMRESK